MAKNSKIEWTHHTANLWWGCTKVHDGCDNCYAECLSKRFGDDVWGHDKPRKEIKSFFTALDKYQKAASAAGAMHRVFVGSMMDIFEKPMSLIDDKGAPRPYDTSNIRWLFFMNIDMGLYPNLTFLLLTKRPSNINKYIPENWKVSPPENVMFGTSVVNQKTAHDLINQLATVTGQRFVSIEPQLDYVDLMVPDATHEHNLMHWLHWVIQGGESGPRRRPFDTAWARKVRDDCRDSGVPYFFKQIDKVKTIPLDLEIRQFQGFLD